MRKLDPGSSALSVEVGGSFGAFWALGGGTKFSKRRRRTCSLVGPRVYFVAEARGSLSTLELKGAEGAKTECASRFFDSLNKNGQDITYNAVTNYAELMQLFSALAPAHHRF